MVTNINVERITTPLTELMTRELADQMSPCIACAVVQHGKTVWQKTMGYAHIASKAPVKENSIYRIYSMTKPITAVAAHILIERGMLDYYDPVCSYIPAFSDMRVYTEQGNIKAEREMYIIDLLGMTSGLVYPGENPVGKETEKLVEEIYVSASTENPIDLQEFCNRLGGIPLAFQPGERWCYGFSADVMGAVIEEVSGKSLCNFLKDEIFNPLQMMDTDFYVPQEKWSRLVTLYEEGKNEKGLYLKEKENRNLGMMDYRQPPAFESGGAGLFSTLGDYAKFAAMLANGGIYENIRILGEKTIELLSLNQLNETVKKTIDFDQIKGHGYGNFMRVYENLPAYGSSGNIGEFGWGGWTGPYMTIDRKENLAIVMMRQVADHNHPEILRRYRNIIYAGL